jgi:hypothetical protein
MRVLAALVTLISLAFSDGATAQERWIEFSSPRYGFAALFPKAPTESLDGTTRKFLAAVGNSAYLVSVTDLPAATKADDAFYWDVVQGYAKGGKLTLRMHRPVTFVHNAGVEVIADREDNNVHSLAYIFPVGKRLYQVMSAGPKGHETTADAHRFRDSFRLQSK